MTAAPAYALSCAMPDEVYARADSAFTGRIVDAQDGSLHVEVLEVWRGDPADQYVVLAVELAGWSSWADPATGEIPDGYSSPEVLLFAPNEEGEVSPCSVWSPNDEYVAHLRPKSPKTPRPAPAAEVRAEPASAPTTRAGQERGATADRPQWALVVGGAGVLVALGLARWPGLRRARPGPGDAPEA